ncbi:unnamed protein product [Caenorhabditis nigoni]
MKYDLTILASLAFYILILRNESENLLESVIDFIVCLFIFLVVRWVFVFFTCMKRAADDGEHYEASGKIDTARTDSEKIMVTYGDRSWRPMETKDSRMMMYKVALILWIVTALVVSYCVTIHSKTPETLTECLKRIQLIIIATCFFIFVLSILSCFLLSCILAAKQWRWKRVRIQTLIENARSLNSDFFSDYNGLGLVDVYLPNEEPDFTLSQLERGVYYMEINEECHQTLELLRKTIRENEEEEAGKRFENQEDSKKDMYDKQKEKDPLHRRRPYVRIPKEDVQELVELAAIVKKVYPESVLITINDYEIVNMSENISIKNLNLYGPSNDRTIRKLRRLAEAIRKAGVEEVSFFFKYWNISYIFVYSKD